MRNAVICGYQRSPFTPAYKGGLASIRPDDLLARVLVGLQLQTNLNPDDVEDVIVGCAFPEGEQGLNIARTVSLLAGLPDKVAGTTVNRFCGSSMQAVHIAAGAIAAGAGNLFICGGIESMSRVPMMGYNPMPNPTLQELNPGMYLSMGQTAENIVSSQFIDRAKQEQFALASHLKANAARNGGKFDAEICSIIADDVDANEDECIRPNISAGSLAMLKPAFCATGTITAGTSSPLTDGAAAVLVAEEQYALEHGLIIMARIKSMAVTGCDPALMGLGPVNATARACSRAGITVDQLDVIELNEAFAAQALACIDMLKLNPSVINIDGGAIALGHPLGATGARIVGKAASLLVRENKQFALATQCIGGGQGIATILERVIT